MHQPESIPTRDDVDVEDTWDLTKIFKSDAAWNRGYRKLESMLPTFDTFRGTLGRSARCIRSCLEFEGECKKLADRLAVYVYLKNAEDVSDATYQKMGARQLHLATRARETMSFIVPELLRIPRKRLDEFMRHPLLADYRFQLKKLARYRPHTLSEKEERLLAMRGALAASASNVFAQLNDADLSFGQIADNSGKQLALNHNSYYSLLTTRGRTLRRRVFTRYYRTYKANEHTIAATLRASVLQDVYQSKVRNYRSSLESALFPDNIPLSVYDNLIETVHANLDTVHRYMALRKRALRIKAIHEYDIYVPIVRSPGRRNSYTEAVGIVCDALAPLGVDYANVMRKGLLEGRWVDRYENKGKQSGAFSYGAYGTPPYIMLNYKEDVAFWMFGLAHEAGHAMHTYFSAKHQPYHYSRYPHFAAEVAATFNEQFLGAHLIRDAGTRREKARLIENEIDTIRGKVIGQTMFAEFERTIHALAEAGQPLTLEVFRAAYRRLLMRYNGPDFMVDKALELEGLRIPHFYRPFHSYQYATGLSAAIALSEMVVNGGDKERERYLNFLKSGGSKFPLDLLKDAGVDLTTPAPVDAAMARFATLVDELETLV